jgi:hypothetical protein
MNIERTGGCEVGVSFFEWRGRVVKGYFGTLERAGRPHW